MGLRLPIALGSRLDEEEYAQIRGIEMKRLMIMMPVYFEWKSMRFRATALLLLTTLFCVPVAFAGIFGPSNFEECVLDKMKGQAPNLMYMARAACLKAFPPEPTEVVIDNERIKYTWCDWQSVCLEKIPPNVKITKVEGVFFEDQCDVKEQSKPAVKAMAEKPWYGATYKFADLPYGTRKCAYFTFYGLEK